MSNRHERKLTNQEKGDNLEDAVALVLEMFLTDGHIVSEYALSKKRGYPDFWVKDAKGRQWLIECKNREVHGLRQGGIWMENARWVRKNLLSKAWNERVYQARLHRGRTGRRHGQDRINIRVSRPIPALVTTLLTFNPEAMALVRGLFGNNIVQTVFPSWYAGSGWHMELINGLRRLFTS